MRRHEISDATWQVVAPLLPGKATDCGGTAQHNRLFFHAVLWMMRTGCPWADLPERFGKANSVCKRLRRLAQKGVWEHLFDAVKAPELEWVMLDSPILRDHQHSAGQKKRCRHRVPRPQPGRYRHQASRLHRVAKQCRAPAGHGGKSTTARCCRPCWLTCSRKRGWPTRPTTAMRTVFTAPSTR